MTDITSPKILCIGDFMCDLFIEGTVDRISPEAPIPIIKEKTRFFALGGAGNVVRNLSALGVETYALGVIDEEEAGQQLERGLKDLPNVHSFLIKDKEWTTPFKTRFSSQGQQLLRFDQEKTCVINQDIEEKLIEILDDILPQIQGVILSDYNKGILTETICQTMIQKARQQGKIIIVDPKGTDYTKYKDASFITPNLSELRAASNRALTSRNEVIRAACNLQRKINVSGIIVTLGPDGMMVIKNEKDVLHIPSKAKEVFDVSGAGDTVIATLAFALAQNNSLEDAANLANKAGGIVVGKVGTAVIYPHELFDYREGNDKIFTPSGILDQVSRWRRQGLKIGFTNGCFDLLHLGHLHLLRQSKSQCDRLIVGLNTDNSIKKLKGESRPIQNDDVRSHVLSSLELVDAVVLFDEDTPIQLIQNILPDVLIKGADYQVHQVVGADIVIKNGGRVYLATLKEGYSTTNTVKKLKAAI